MRGAGKRVLYGNLTKIAILYNKKKCFATVVIKLFTLNELSAFKLPQGCLMECYREIKYFVWGQKLGKIRISKMVENNPQHTLPRFFSEQLMGVCQKSIKKVCKW